MKKILALILMLAMVLSLAACGNKTTDSGNTNTDTKNETTTTDDKKDDASEGTTEGTDDNAGAATSGTPLDTLVVGCAEMNGDFIGGFGNSSYDQDIKTILHGFCDTVYQTAAGSLDVAYENVVKAMDTVENADGSKTYTFTIYDDLKWNNGDPITADQYVGSILYAASPEWLAAGASSTAGEGMVGYSAYYAGETKVFAGLKLIDEYTFSITLDSEYLPYFYELSYLAVGPLYLPNYLPGATVASDETGSWFEGDFDLTAATQNIAATERFAPTVTCGPYKFVSFDNQICTMELNENFKCDYEGNVPTLKYVVQKAVSMDTDVDQVIAGELDMVGGVIEGSKIEAAKASSNVNLHSYFRSGYGMIALVCDWGPTADPNVRWALASLIDRAAVIDYVLGGYGGTVDAEYGTAQWTYQERVAELAEQLKPITFNVETANKYLDATEWKFEADGTTPFDASKATADGSYLRHNAAGEPLVVEHFGTTENTVTDIIEIQYAANAPLAGIKFNITKGDFNVLLDNYYYSYEIPEEERIYSSFNLATNFTAVDDKWYSWGQDWLGTWYNANQLDDDKLNELTLKMRELSSDQTEEYADLWVEFQVRWQELMPNIPLYSNEYFDITGINVDNVNTTPYAAYSNIICQIGKSAK